MKPLVVPSKKRYDGWKSRNFISLAQVGSGKYLTADGNGNVSWKSTEELYNLSYLAKNINSTYSWKSPHEA
jgi:hypothetical protein